jgi:hypothetical protein
MTSRPIFLFLALAAFPVTALAGLVMTTEHKRTEGSDKPSATTVYLEGGSFRADIGGDHPLITIFDGKQMVSADPVKKTYRVMTEEDVKAMAARAGEARAKAKANLTANRAKTEEAMAKMSPEQRKRMEGMLAEAGDGDAAKAPKRPDVKYVATGQKKSVAGYGCEVYRQMREGKLRAETCFIPWSAGVFTKADLGSFQKLEEFMKPLTGNFGERRESFMKAALDAPGVPALTQHLDANGKPTSEERLTSVKRTSVPASQFAVPAGYTKTPNPF